MHVDVHGECVCCGWMQVAREGMFLHGWLLFMVTKFPLFQLNAFIRKKLMFRLLLCSLHQSIHNMHKRLLCMLWWRLQNCSRNFGFFLIKYLVGIKDTL